MNEVYCKLISKRLLYDYFKYSEIQKKQFKKNFLRPLIRKVGRDRFWSFYIEVKKSSNNYLINCNSITKDKRRLRYLENEVIKEFKKAEYYSVNIRKLVY